MQKCRKIEEKTNKRSNFKIGPVKNAFCETEKHQRIFTRLCSKIDVSAAAAVVAAVVSGVFASFHSIYGKLILTFDGVRKFKLKYSV